MSGSDDALISALAADLRPVRRLPRPGVRALGWLAAVLAVGAGLAVVADLPALQARLRAAPDLLVVLLGAGGTAVAAAVAAFQVSVPGRSPLWMMLPLPPALVWLGASGWGCLRSWGVVGLEPMDMAGGMGCLRFIVLVSVPLSALLLWMLRRACPLWPGRVAAMAGLAAAAAAAVLLTLFHDHDASVVDLVLHAVAVILVVVTCGAAGGRLLA